MSTNPRSPNRKYHNFSQRAIQLSPSGIRKFFDLLASIEGVQGTVTHFMLKRYKEDGEIIEGKEEVKRQPVTL